MKHTTSFPRRAGAFFLALLLLLPTVYAASGEQKLQTSVQVAEGLTYRNTVSVNRDSRLESFSFELSPHSEVYPILLQGDGTIYGRGSINSAVSNAQAAGWHVLGAINADFFSMTTGVPMGIVIENGVYKSSGTGGNAMAITDGRVSVLDPVRVSLSLYDQNSDLTVVPDNFNKYRGNGGGVYLLNEHFSTVSTRSDGAGWYVRMKAEADPDTGRAPDLTVNSTLTLEVTELLLSDQSITIGPDEYILTASDQANRIDAYNAFQVGDKVTLTTGCEDPVLSAAQWAGGVGDIMVRDGAITDSSNWVYRADGRQPRSAMGIKADGTLVLYAVDGRQSGYSAGLSQMDLAEELLAQGCVTAVNLDGGGSTSLSVWMPGQAGPAMQNKSSDGRARGCATFLLLVTDQRGDGTPRRLAPAETGQVVLTGSSLPLPQVTAVDAGLNPVSAELYGLTWSSRNGLGAILDNVYTAGRQTGTDTLRASSIGLEGTAQVHVVDQLTELKVTRAGSSSALNGLAVRPGEQVQLAVTGSYWGRTALRDFGPVSVTVQGDGGTVDQNGLFTASQNPEGCSITFSAGGQSQTVQLYAAYAHDDVPEGHWAYTAVEYCYAHGIATGITATEYGADIPMRRGDFMLMLYNAMGRPAVSTACTFTDVTREDYFFGALSWAQSVGLANGMDDGRFAPYDNITREQAFALFYRFLPLLNKSCPDGDTAILDQFPDNGNLAPYARTACATLISQGLVSGTDDGSLLPQSTLTRAQMAALVYRVLQHTPIIPSVPGEPSGEEYTLTLDQVQVTLAPGGSVTLGASIQPGAEGAAVTWSSSDPETAAVSSTGMVTNLYPGTGEKTVTITASWNGLTASCAVTCQQALHTGLVVNAENGLNVRSGPGTTFSKVGALRSGGQVVVLGQESGWYQVLFLNPDSQAAIGYVLSDYLTLIR